MPKTGEARFPVTVDFKYRVNLPFLAPNSSRWAYVYMYVQLHWVGACPDVNTCFKVEREGVGTYAGTPPNR